MNVKVNFEETSKLEFWGEQLKGPPVDPLRRHKDEEYTKVRNILYQAKSQSL